MKLQENSGVWIQYCSDVAQPLRSSHLIYFIFYLMFISYQYRFIHKIDINWPIYINNTGKI